MAIQLVIARNRNVRVTITSHTNSLTGHTVRRRQYCGSRPCNLAAPANWTAHVLPEASKRAYDTGLNILDPVPGFRKAYDA